MGAVAAGVVPGAVPPSMPALASSAGTGVTPEDGTSVTLLGSAGGPVPWWSRHGIASALSVNGSVYAVDCGLGMTQRMVQAGFRMSQLNALFITHLHSDHFVDYFNIIQMTQQPAAVGGIGHAIDVYGPDRPDNWLPVPPGGSAPVRSIQDVTNAFLDADSYELHTRPGTAQVNVHLLAPGVASTPTDAAPPMSPFKVMEDNNVRVTATLVQHPPIFPSYAFRFDTDAGSVVFSGDTSPSPNLIQLASGADVLVHEVFDRTWLRTTSPTLAVPFEAAHTASDEVGLVATQAGAEVLMLSHLVPGDARAVSDRAWSNAARRHFAGPVLVGHDLTTLTLRHGHKPRVTRTGQPA